MPDVEEYEVAAGLVVASFCVVTLLAPVFSLAGDTGLLVEAALVGSAVRGLAGDVDVEDIGVSVPGDDDAVLRPPVAPPEALLLLPWSTDETVAGPFKDFSAG